MGGRAFHDTGYEFMRYDPVCITKTDKRAMRNTRVVIQVPTFKCAGEGTTDR